MFEFESQFGTVILECACAVSVMCAVLVVSHWWYRPYGVSLWWYLIGGVSNWWYLIGGISLPGTTG